ncbi:MAG: hypothetical protein N3B10_13810 [Armatimonadetes bacterium]|nr:hypothetical protein [Armatimonadota bacterium]MCX7969545.1 hypothetical protein [Armatimonadota bacterium]
MVLLVSDESGDLGLKGSLSYVTLMLLIKEETHAPIIVNVANQLSIQFFRHPLRKWNSLEGKHKRDVKVLKDFVEKLRQQIFSAVNFSLLATAVLMDKRFIKQEQSPKLYNDPAFRMGWCYGLMLKRVGRLLEMAERNAQWIVDRNSEPLMRNLTIYSTSHIPTIAGFIRRYSSPQFCSPKDQPILILSDFMAGLTRRCFESFLQSGTTYSFTYQPVRDKLKGIFYASLKLPSGRQWKWEGLLYWPVERINQAKPFLAYP